MAIGSIAFKYFPAQTLSSAQAVFGPNPPASPAQTSYQTLSENDVMNIYNDSSAYIFKFKDDLFINVAFKADTTVTDEALCGYATIEGLYNVSNDLNPLTQLQKTWDSLNKAWDELSKTPEAYLGQLRTGIQYNVDNLTDAMKESAKAAYTSSKASLDEYARCLSALQEFPWTPLSACTLKLSKEASTALLSIGYNTFKSDVDTLTDPQANCFQKVVALGDIYFTVNTLGEAQVMMLGDEIALEPEENTLLTRGSESSKYVFRIEFNGLEKSFHFLEDDTVFTDINKLTSMTPTKTALASSLRASIDTALAAKLQQAPLTADYLLKLPGDSKKALLKALGYDSLEMSERSVNLNVNKLETNIAKSTLKSLVKDIGNKLQNPSYELRRVKGKGYLITVKGVDSGNNDIAFHFWKSDQSSFLCLSYVQMDSQPGPEQAVASSSDDANTSVNDESQAKEVAIDFLSAYGYKIDPKDLNLKEPENETPTTPNRPELYFEKWKISLGLAGIDGYFNDSYIIEQDERNTSLDLVAVKYKEQEVVKLLTPGAGIHYKPTSETALEANIRFIVGMKPTSHLALEADSLIKGTLWSIRANDKKLLFDSLKLNLGAGPALLVNLLKDESSWGERLISPPPSALNRALPGFKAVLEAEISEAFSLSFDLTVLYNSNCQPIYIGGSYLKVYFPMTSSVPF